MKNNNIFLCGFLVKCCQFASEISMFKHQNCCQFKDRNGLYFTWPLKASCLKANNQGTNSFKSLSEGLGNEDKVPCPRALLLLPAESNRGPHDWESVVLSTEPHQLLCLLIILHSCKQSVYGSEFWTMYNWPFSDLEHFYYTWFAPSYSETISFGVVVKSTNRAFRKHILYIPLLIFIHHTGLQMQKKNDKKWCFYTFSFFRNHSVNVQATLPILC